MKVYLASMYSTRSEINTYAKDLRKVGIEVTSTWLKEPHATDTQIYELRPDKNEEYAVADLRDIDRADWFVFFSKSPDIPTIRGGRHVEFGYALASHKPILVVGPKENIFHYLSEVEHVDTWEAALMYLINAEDENEF